MWQRFLAVGVVLFGWTVQAQAICPDPTPRPCYLFHRSKVTFIGTVIAEKVAPGDRQHDAGIVYTLRVVRQFRGAPARSIRVFTEHNSGGEYLSTGKTYVVFAKEGDRKHPLVISCRMTEELQDVEAAVRMLENVSQRKGHVNLRGRVEDRGKPVAGATVRVLLASKGIVILTTSKEGIFEAKLPPDEYHVGVHGPDGRRMRQTDYNFMLIDARRFFTRPGECVDLVFEYESN